MTSRFRRWSRPIRIAFDRALATSLIAAVFLLGCPPGNEPLSPSAGLPEFQSVGMIPVPGPALLNVTGGNLLVPRTDLSIDTQIGLLEVAAVWNSATREWRFNFDHIRYGAGTFVDATGLSMAIASLPAGSAIPGTHWVKASESVIETKGGLRYEFGADGRLRTMRWASSALPKLDFQIANGPDGQPHTQSISQCLTGAGCQLVYEFEYDAQGRPIEVTDRAGRSAAYTWNALGRLATARDGLDMARGWPGTRYAYSLDGDLVGITNSEGERVEYGVSSRRVGEIRQIGPGTPTRQIFYEGKNQANLRVTRYVDATGRETRFRYDDSRRLHEIEAAAIGDRIVRTWVSNRVTSLVMPDGATTSWTYQSDDVATRTDPSGNVTVFQYAGNAVNRWQPLRTPVTTITDTIGAVETRTYDAQGRLWTIANGEGDTTTLAYGADEMVSSQTLANGVVIGFQAYGQHGRATSITVDGQTYPYFYDLVGNRRSGEAPVLGLEEGGIVAREYDADRNVARLLVGDYFNALAPTSEDPEVVEILYRSDRRPLAIRRPRGADHEYQYDGFGREILRREKVDGEWRNTTRGYDLEGRPASVSLANGMGQEMSYDDAGRPYVMTMSRNGQVAGSLGMLYSAGRLSSVLDTTRGWESYQYDSAGRLTSMQFVGGERLDYSYDYRSRLVAENYWMPGDVPLRFLTWAHDGAGRPTGLHDGSTLVHQKDFEGGVLAEETFGNGLRRTYAYDPASGMLDGSTTRNAQSQTIETTTIERTWLAALTYVGATTTTSVGAAATTEEGYWLGPAPVTGPPTLYPTAHQGKRVAAIDVTGTGPFPFASYDSLSNQVNDTVATVSYNAERNRLLSANGWSGAASYTYDAAGFVTSRNGQPMTWTASGRLASYGSSVALTWDLLGRLVSTTVNGTTTRFLFGGRVEADAQGNPVAIELGNVRLGLQAGVGRRYRHSDFRGNVKLVTGDAGTVLTHYRYEPYGVVQTIGSAADPIRFVGGRQIGDLVILGARVLDPVVGRFLSQDPILNLLNQYTYTLGNPIWFSDPTGLSTAQGVGFALGTYGGLLGVLSAYAAVTGASAALVVGLAAGGWLFVVVGAGIALVGVGGSGGGGGSGSGCGCGGGNGGGGGGGDGNGGDGGSGGSPAPGPTASPGASVPVCAPTDLSWVPERSLLFLLPLQVLLALAILRARRRRAA